MYLPGLEMTLSFQRYSAKDAERQMLFEHLDQLESDDLLVLDQGYLCPADIRTGQKYHSFRRWCRQTQA